MTERSGVEELFERQEAERQEFVQEQINRLNKANFNWKLPEDFKKEFGYQGKGLITMPSSGGYEVLNPDEGLIYVGKNNSPSAIALIGGGMTGSGISHLEALEEKVDETLAQLSEPKFPNPLRRLIPGLS